LGKDPPRPVIDRAPVGPDQADEPVLARHLAAEFSVLEDLELDEAGEDSDGPEAEKDGQEARPPPGLLPFDIRGEVHLRPTV
jgi:hypothetical protein